MPAIVDKTSKQEESYNDQRKRRLTALKMKVSPLTILKRFFDPNEPWVLVPDGSIGGIFDYVPRHLRVGPWHFLIPYYMVGIVIAIIYYKPESLIENLEVVYPEAYSNWWYYNVVIGIWMLGFIMNLLWNFFPAIGTYTVQSWIYITLRHCLTALAPFLNDDTHVLIKLNEFLRFTAIATATTTFVFWNFLIGPFIYYYIDDPKQKTTFLLWNFEFKMIQVHICNIIYAFLNIISVSPRRLFTYDDIWCACLVAVLYKIFYAVILDRLGIHIYPIFSPRSKFTAVFSLVILGLYGSLSLMYNKAMEMDIFAFGME